MTSKQALTSILGVAAGSYAAGAKIHLYVNDIQLTPVMTPGDFEEADYDGYAAAVLASVTPAFDDVAGNAILSYGPFTISPTGSTKSNTIRGYWLQPMAGGVEAANVLCATRFAEPVVVTDPSDRFVVTPYVAINQPQGTIDFTP